MCSRISERISRRSTREEEKVTSTVFRIFFKITICYPPRTRSRKTYHRSVYDASLYVIIAIIVGKTYYKEIYIYIYACCLL